MIRLDLTFSVNEFGKGMGRLNRLMFQIFDYDHQETDPSSQQNDDDEDNEPEPPDFLGWKVEAYWQEANPYLFATMVLK